MLLLLVLLPLIKCCTILHYGTVIVPLVQEGFAVIGEMSIGTPQQKIRVMFDTGTSDTVIYNSTLDSSKSTTFKSLKSPFSIIYGSGEVNGTWSKDDLQFNSATIKGMQFGLGESSSDLPSQYALIGIGLPNFETSYTSTYGVTKQIKHSYIKPENPYTYDNFPQRLKKQGLIEKCMYSLYYHNNFSQAQYVFGGVDIAKYESLFSVPIVIPSGDAEPTLLVVELDSIGVDSELTTSRSYPALIDSGTYPLVLPEVVLENMVSALEGDYDTDTLEIAYDCRDVQFRFSFGGETISIGANSMSVFDDGVCYLSVYPSPDEYIILGITYLRNVYTAWDLDKFEILFGNVIDVPESRIVGVDHGHDLPKSHKVAGI